MQDDISTPKMAMTEPAPHNAHRAIPVKRSRSGFGAFLLAMTMFLVGGCLVVYAAWQGELDRFLPAKQKASSAQASDTYPIARVVAPADMASAMTPQAIVSVETRLAMLEDRFSRLDFKADAASGNAARAEALLLALAARRQVERGEPLGYISDQLKMRFSEAQPQAVETIIAFARAPVTIDQLAARLDALAPNLTDRSQQTSFVERSRRAIIGLFVVHTDSPTLIAPSARIDRARLMLTSRRIVNAIDEVERLPGADAATKWVADALRFEAAQRALDLIETTAMMESRRLKDGSGQNVDQPSPLTTAQPSPQSRVTQTTSPDPAAPTVQHSVPASQPEPAAPPSVAATAAGTPQP